MRKLLKYIAPKSFNDGLYRCNTLGKKLAGGRAVERFLDVGCGDGRLTMEFAEIAQAKELYGIEYVDEFRQEAEKRGIRCSRQDLNGRWDFEDDFFDLILSSQNIEHLHNTRLYLEESYRCLRENGRLIVLTENLASWANIWALVFGWQPFSTTNINGWSAGNPLIWHSDLPRDEEFISTWQDTGVSGTVGHVRVLAYRGLKNLLEKTGFRNVRVFSRGYLPLWGSLSDALCTIDRRHGHFLIATGLK
ncbi:class I SAM-dependent methyltransferase [bacterium]|nr:class I SAM-dependent methyltransferase [bacterium]